MFVFKGCCLALGFKKSVIFSSVMDPRKQEINRERSANPDDEGLREASYRAHRQSGQSPLEFAALAMETVKQAEERIAQTKESAAHDIMHMLCRTAEEVLPEWPKEITTIVLANPSEDAGMSLYDHERGIEKGTISGEKRKIPFVYLPYHNLNLYCCAEGIFVNLTYWHQREVPVDALLSHHSEYYNFLHKESLAQHTKKILGELLPVSTYFETESELHGMPVSIEHEEDGTERLFLYLGHQLTQLALEGNKLQPFEVQARPIAHSHATHYHEILDTLHFEAERRKQGDDPKTLLTYLRQRD